MEYFLELLQENYDYGDEIFKIDGITLRFETRVLRDMIASLLKLKDDQVEISMWEEGEEELTDCQVCLCYNCLHKGLCICSGKVMECVLFKGKGV